MAWYRGEDDFFLPPQCTLPFEQQVRNLFTAFEATDFLRKHPLLPPYTTFEVLAMEVDNKIRFPEILRFYMLHISRETCFELGRSIIAPPYFRGSSHPSKRSWLAFCQAACAGEEFVIPFSGRGKGFIMLSDEGLRSGGQWETLYDCLARGPFQWHEDQSHQPTLEQHHHTIQACDWPNFEQHISTRKNWWSDRYERPSKWSVCDWVHLEADCESGSVSELADSIKQASLPDDLRTFKCEDKIAAITLMTQAMLTRCVEETLGVPARTIQRQFRLWRWRLKTIFNPHTILGQYNLRIKANASIRV